MTSQPQSPKSDDHKYPAVASEKGQEILRSMVQHEDELRDQRLGYLLTLNGLLFAALAFAWNVHHARSLVSVLALMGILIAISAFLSTTLSSRAIRHLRERQSPAPDHQGADWTEADEIKSIPVAVSKDQLPQSLVFRAFQPWKALPFFMGLAWVAIFILAFKFLAA
jgi:hypothetical protein